MCTVKEITYKERPGYFGILDNVGSVYLGSFNSKKEAEEFIENYCEPIGYSSYMGGWQKELVPDQNNEMHIYTCE